MRMQGVPVGTPGRWLAAAGVTVVTALAAPALAQTEEDSPEAPAGEVALDEVDTYRLALLEMRGHLSVARALIRLEAAGAEHHMGASLAGTFRRVEDALERRNAPVTEDMLSELENAATLEPGRALRAVESAVQAINGSFAQTGALDRTSVLGLIEALLRRAVANYADAVEDNEVVDLRRYQTGRGFVIQAEALARHATPLQDLPGHEELVDVVTLIRQAWPSVLPPPIVFDPATVTGRLDQAVAIMQELR